MGCSPLATPMLGVAGSRSSPSHRPASCATRAPTRSFDAAIREGADLVGGIDPCAFDRDPVRHLDAVFGLAERHQVGVDLHLHESGELGAFTVELIAERVAALGMHGRVTVSHAFVLSSVDAARQEALIELLSEFDIAVTTVAPGTREPLPLAALQAAGVRVGLARTASAITGRHTATATSSNGRGSLRIARAPGATSWSRRASTSLRGAGVP